jgi:16S rRNA (guanine527-N7)-methyltransferase
MCSDNIPQFVADQLHRLDVSLTGEMLRTLSRYLDRLLDANRRFNLTGIRELDEAWRRHVIDSLTLLAFIEDAGADAKLIDVGSGGGLPGIPVAIARPDLQVTLAEATGKKAAFCQQCVDELPLANVQVLPQRSETIGQQRGHRQAYDVAVCRAIGSMPELLEYTLPLLRVGGRLLAMKGPKARNELEQSADALAILGGGELSVYDAYPPGFDQGSVIVLIAKSSPTPRPYPRPPGTARRSPL